MKALTICQPFAHLIIVTREKRVENREWPTNHRGPLLIHAGKSRSYMGGSDLTPDMAFGALVGIVDLVDCLHIDKIERNTYADSYPWLLRHPHTEGTWCWILANPRRFAEPVSWKGALGLWNVADADAARFEVRS